MRVNFTIVALFDAENEVNSTTLNDVLIDAKVPRSHLETVQDV